MAVRKRALPEGWYPQNEKAAAVDLEACFGEASSIADIGPPSAFAAVAPHASWFYCGALAAASVAALREDTETVVVCGGHLSEGARPLAALEDAFQTPFGLAESDVQLRDRLVSRFDFLADSRPDNTVEILLPLVKRRFPSARVVWLRMPASLESYRIGESLAEIARDLGRTVSVLGSTDLTHYGPNYGFMPRGGGDGALRWVRETNDRRFLDALLSGDAEESLRRALEEGSACSPGGALAALGFARASGAAAGRLLAYATSADTLPASSFVGYASLCWRLT
jgi:AmmeMemoRadiSam system protein B